MELTPIEENTISSWFALGAVGMMCLLLQANECSVNLKKPAGIEVSTADLPIMSMLQAVCGIVHQYEYQVAFDKSKGYRV